MYGQLIGATVTVVVGVLAAFVYFWGTNWLLDQFLRSDQPGLTGKQSVRRDTLRSRIRPWLFLFPALFFLGVYLGYPVFATLWLSLFDRTADNFVGLANYAWAFSDPRFLQSAGNNLLWLIVVPSVATGFGLLVAVLADRLWWGNIAKSMIFMPMAISFVGASVIWKFVFDFRGPDADQIGVLNAIVRMFGGSAQAWITFRFGTIFS